MLEETPSATSSKQEQDRLLDLLGDARGEPLDITKSNCGNPFDAQLAFEPLLGVTKSPGGRVSLHLEVRSKQSSNGSENLED